MKMCKLSQKNYDWESYWLRDHLLADLITARAPGERERGMPERRAPSVRSRQLAAELRRLRGEAALTGDEVAARLSWSPAKVSRIETGRTVVSPADLQSLLDLYEVAGQHRDRLTELGRAARQRGWWDTYADMLGPEYATLIALEADADTVSWYAAQIVPGLLQTEEYARQIIRSTLLISPPGEIERRIQVRMNRQRVLTTDPPLNLAAILDEAVLRRVVGGPEVMRAQLRHLAEAAARPNIDLRVLPAAAGAHPAVTGEFTILRFPEMNAPDVVYLENMTSNLYVESEAEVFRYTMAFDRLNSLALGPEDSAALVSELANAL
jgi:transcriptional regulator with XRE-family HTH domain